MSDYLSCGSCPSEFELKEFPDFIEHKLRSCHVSNTTNILECLQCFKKFHTSMPLLIHLQKDHHLAIVKMYTLPRTARENEEYHEAIHRIETAALSHPKCTQRCMETQTMRTSARPMTFTPTVTIPSVTSTEPLENEIRRLSGGEFCSPDTTTSSLPRCYVKEEMRTGEEDDEEMCDCAEGSQKVDSGTCGGWCSCTAMNMRPPVKDEASQTEFEFSEHDNNLDLFFPSEQFDDSINEAANQYPSLTEPYDSHEVVTPDEPHPNFPCPIAESEDLLRPSYSMQIFQPNRAKKIEMDGLQHFLPEANALTSSPYHSVVRPIALDGKTLLRPMELYNHVSSSSSSTSPTLYMEPISGTMSTQNTTTTNLSYPSLECLTNNLDMESSSPCHSSAPESPPPSRQHGHPSATCLSSGSSNHHHATMDPGDPLRHVMKDPRYTCEQCGRTFRQNVHLRKHVMSYHDREKPHKCSMCDYSTVEKSHLTVHLRKHTGEKPFHCRNCDYSSAQNCTLKNHYFRKHPTSRIMCTTCHREFVTNLERDNHAKSCLAEN